jgi:hypothetical protein
VSSRARSRAAWSAHGPLATFVVVLLGAFVLYMTVGRDYWFRADDWAFLIGKDGGSFQDLFREQHEHWNTVPIVVYRVWWHIFGLHYTAYLLPVVLLHLTAGVLLRTIMIRAGVGAWMATLVASTVVLLSGSGSDNIIWAFQMGFTGSLVCGLAYLLLTDHDGPFDRRDAAGLCLGLIGLMCSGVGVTMVLVVGVFTLLRRGWRIALVHVVPLAAAFVAWFTLFERRTYADSGGKVEPAAVLRFIGRGSYTSLERITRAPGGALVLLAVLVAGLGMAWWGLPRSELRRRAAAPAALLLGALSFLAVVGVGRGPTLTSHYATISRFVHVVVVLGACALAVALDAIVRRAWVLGPVVALLLTVGMVRNVQDLSPAVPGGRRPAVLAAASVPALRTSPAALRPFAGRIGEGLITAGWLRDGVEAGKIDVLRRPDPYLAAVATLNLGLAPRDADPVGSCQPMKAHKRRLEVGDELAFRGTIVVELVTRHRYRHPVVRGFSSARGMRVVAVTGPLTLRVVPYPGSPAQVCT